MRQLKKFLALSVITMATCAISPAGWAANLRFLADPQIVHVSTTANNGEIQMGELALDKAKDQRVKDFAMMMVKHHSANNALAMSLADQLGIAPLSNEISASLQMQVERDILAFKDLYPHAFDYAYINQQVFMHQQNLDLLDHHLIPNARNASLKQFLANTRPIVAEHLQVALDLRLALGARD